MLQQDTLEEIQISVEYLNTVWLRKDRTRNLEVRPVYEDEHKYGYYDLDVGKFTRIMYFWEVIEEARTYRLVEWRRAYFKQIDGGIQCSICGAKFRRASQHLAPCVEVS